jgi:starch synthase
MAPRVPRALRILMIASEAHPFSKTGGLADVATALPRALGGLGHDVTLVTPRYRGAQGGPEVDRFPVAVGDRRFEAVFLEHRLGPGARVLLVDVPILFDRPGLYFEGGVDYSDNPLRFAVLTAAALDWSQRQKEPFHVVHGHDWQAGLAPLYLRDRSRSTSGTSSTRAPEHSSTPGTRTVFTIHNLAYQGMADKVWVPRLGLRWEDFTVAGFEFYDRLSFLKAGINFSDAITTVSPTYADEIQRPEYGYGFDGIIRERRDRLTGILNGIDAEEWNPAADRFLPAAFDHTDLSGKGAVKRALLEAFGFSVTPALLERPVIGIVSRLVHQKGFDLLAAAAEELPALDATWVVLGSGEPQYEDMWRGLALWRPDRVAVHIGFDERRAHLIEGGADVFLMPSRYEPCGLNQMYSLRYGTVPVVRAVGGLVDTVRPYNPRNGQGTGFLFADYTPWAMLGVLRDAVSLYHGNRRAWTRIQKNGMRKDFSWQRSAREYVKVYKGVMASRRETRSGGHGI